MSDISLNTQQQLSQALAQLTQAQSSSPIARQAAQVIIQHLAGNQISVSVPRQAQSIQLPKPDKLPAGIVGTPVEAQLQTTTSTTGKGRPQPTLSLFDYTTTQGANTLLARVNHRQISVILDAVATKVEPQAGNKTQIVNAKVVGISGNTVSVTTQINGNSQSIKLTLSPVPTGLTVGQTIQLHITPKGSDWQVSLLSATKGVANSAASSVALDKQQMVKLLQADTARPVSANQANPENNLSIPRHTLVETAARQPGLLPASALEKLANIPSQITRVNLLLSQSGSGEITVVSPQPAATIKLSPEQLKQLQALLASDKMAETKAMLAQRPNAIAENKLIGSAPIHPEARQSLTGEVKIDLPGLTNKQSIADIPSAQRQVLQQQISDIIRRLLPQTASPSDALGQIENSLKDTLSLKDPAAKAIIEQLSKQLQQVAVQGKESDANQIKQLITQAALPITSVQLTQPVSQQQGLMSGLITLVQVALSARLARAQPQNSERLTQAISSFIGISSKSSDSQPRRNLNDVNQLENKHQILKQLGKLFAQHQTNKLASAEQTLQGQEALYYVLPSGTGDTRKDVELLIKREPDQQQQDDEDQSKNSVWHLTMKLDVGDIGQILSKATLRDMTLELDFYTSNEQVKDLIFNYLPLFKKRLESLGIEVAKTHCQLGKIPDRLHTRPYQIVETKA